MHDLTIIYLTLNRLPAHWVKFQRKHLDAAIGGCPVVSVSREPMDFGTNLLQDPDPPSGWNVYRQVRRAAEIADTKYIGIAEDDTLYTREHFNYRPPEGTVGYDLSRWSLYVWEKKPVYSCVYRYGNFAMTGDRQLVVDALRERENKHPSGYDKAGEIGRPAIERRLGVTVRQAVEHRSKGPIVTLSHSFGLSNTYLDVRGLQRRHGELQAYDIPKWGSAQGIADIFNKGT